MSGTMLANFSGRLLKSMSVGVIGLTLVLPANLSAMAAESLSLSKGQAKVFRVSRPAGSIIVGDPNVLKANLHDLETLVLTGGAFGTTNLIVLDQNGEAMLDRMVIVEEGVATNVRVYSPLGNTVQVKKFACNSTCDEPEVTAAASE